jgi:hypothetical protein
MAYLATTMQRGMGMALLALALGQVGCGDDDGELVDARPMVDAALVPDAALPVDAAPPAEDAAEDAAPPAEDAAPPAEDAMLPVDPCSDDCPDTSGVAPPTTGVIIEAVRVASSQLVLRNAAPGAADLSGWYLARRPSYHALPNGFTLAPGAAVTIHVGVGGANDAGNLYVPGVDPLGEAGEAALYVSAAFFDDDAVHDFVRWGDAPSDPATTSHVGEAIDAGRWSGQDDFVEICDGHAGVVATGDTTTPDGYTSVVDACL